MQPTRFSPRRTRRFARRRAHGRPRGSNRGSTPGIPGFPESGSKTTETSIPVAATCPERSCFPCRTAPRPERGATVRWNSAWKRFPSTRKTWCRRSFRRTPTTTAIRFFRCLPRNRSSGRRDRSPRSSRPEALPPRSESRCACKAASEMFFSQGGKSARGEKPSRTAFFPKALSAGTRTPGISGRSSTRAPFPRRNAPA